MGIIGNYVMWRLPPNSSRNQAKLRRSVVRSFESYLEPGIRPIQGTLAGEIRLAFEPPSERSCSHDECELGWTHILRSGAGPVGCVRDPVQAPEVSHHWNACGSFGLSTTA